MEKEKKSPGEIAKMTLESKLIQNVAGANFAHTSFGEEGKSTYEMFMEGKEIRELQEKEFQGLKREYKSLGVVGEPNYPVKQDTSYKILKQIEENKPFVFLGDLEQIIKSIAPGFEFELPENLKKYNYANLSQIAMEKGAVNKENGQLDIKKLSPEEQEAFEKYNILSEAYNKACSLQILNLYSFAELNAIDKSITEKYHPKEQKQAA